MVDYDKHYAILGLKRGATKAEVQSAFRRMAKLYHPDQDASPYAEMRYYEVRRAYDALRKAMDMGIQPTESPAPTVQPRETVTYETKKDYSGAGWYAQDFDYDLMYEFYAEERIPFSINKMPIILWKSIAEAASVEMFIRVLLHFAVMNNTLRWLGYGGLLSRTIIICSLIGFALFRYYFFVDPAAAESGLYKKFLWSLWYIAGMGFLLLLFSSTHNFFRFAIKDWLVVAFEMFIALFLLWVPAVIKKYNVRRRR